MEAAMAGGASAITQVARPTLTGTAAGASSVLVFRSGQLVGTTAVDASDNRGGANNSGPRQPTGKGDEGDIPMAPPAKDEAKTELDVRRKVLGMQAAIMAYVESQRAKGICGDATVRPIANCMKQIAGWAAKPE
jgi:hypothetical protein